MHQFDAVLGALRRLPQGSLQLVVAGGGIHRAHWERRAAMEPALGVRFLPYESEDAYRAMLAACTATLVTLTPGMEALAVPSKAWSSLAAGRPVIAHMAPEADVALVIGRTGAGWVAPDENGVERAFRSLLDDREGALAAGRAARAAYEREFTMDSVTAQYVALVRELLRPT